MCVCTCGCVNLCLCVCAYLSISKVPVTKRAWNKTFALLGVNMFLCMCVCIGMFEERKHLINVHICIFSIVIQCACLHQYPHVSTCEYVHFALVCLSVCLSLFMCECVSSVCMS